MHSPSYPSANDLIARLSLVPHPEGGFYRETYQSGIHFTAQALHGEPPKRRSLSSAIFFLLPQGHYSCFHRLRSDEIWHFYLGGPLEVIRLKPTGEMERDVIGPELGSGQVLQQVLPAGEWFAAGPLPGTDYTLVGCTVSPGFVFEDFEIGKRERLLTDFPHAAEWIEKYSCRW